MEHNILSSLFGGILIAGWLGTLLVAGTIGLRRASRRAAILARFEEN
jgi:hypothetical protein